MKRIFYLIVFLFLFTFFNEVFSQKDINSKVSLKEFCPLGRGQYKATCFAYAPVYTALSILRNIQDKRTDSLEKLKNAFSDYYVASKLNRSNKYLTRTFSCCGQNGTYIKTLELLKGNGVCQIGDFKKRCVKRKRKIKKAEKQLVKIKSYEVYEEVYKYIYHSNGKGKDFTSKEWVVNKLDSGLPVIVAPYQVKSLSNLEGEIWKPTDAEKLLVKNNWSANHVLCIIGYTTDKEGVIYFEIRNNYLPWGKEGFAFVKAEDLLLFVEEAAVMKLN